MSIVLDLPDPQYRAVEALSYSGAKTLLTRSPAHYRWEIDHGRPPKKEFDLGHAVHGTVLGAGPPIVLVHDQDGPAHSYNRKAAQQHRDRIHAEGGIPVTVPQLAQVADMAGAVLDHPEAGRLLAAGRFHPEVSVFWDADDVPCKARLDALVVEGDDGRPVAVDLKTTSDVRLLKLEKVVYDYGYECQAANYLEALEAHGVLDARFLFVFVETDPPHAVRVVELDWMAIQAGRQDMAVARRIYAECTLAGTWPAYPPGVELIGLPRYARPRGEAA